MRNMYFIISLILILILVICLFKGCSINYSMEGFTNRETLPDSYNLLQNGSFQQGTNVSGLVSKKGNNKIISLDDNPNCNVSKYVLEQIGNQSYYVIRSPVMTSSNYKLNLWTTDETNVFIRTDINTTECCHSSELNVKTNVIGEKNINDNTWYKLEQIFSVPSNINHVFIHLGCINKKSCSTNDKHYYTNLVLLPYLRHMPNFNATLGLQTFLDGKNKYSCSDGISIIWNDLSSRGLNYKWKTKPSWDNDGYFRTKNNILTGPSSATLLGRTNEFSLVLQSRNIKNENVVDNGLAIFIPGNQGIAFALSIHDEGIMKMIFSDKIFVFKGPFNPFSDSIYTFTYKNGNLNIWVDGIQLETFKGLNRLYFNEQLVKINQDSKWQADLYTFMVYNKELNQNEINYINYYLKYRPIASLPIIPIEKSKKNKKMKKIKKVKKHSNSDDSDSDEEFKKYKKDCHQECKDYYQDINKCKHDIRACKKYCDDKRSKGDQLCYQKDTDECPTAYIKNKEYMIYIPKRSKYSAKLGWGEQSYGPFKERAHKLYVMNFPDCRIPEVLRYDRPRHDVCPYIVAKGNPCSSEECKYVDWTAKDLDKMGMTKECRKNISHYCHKNKDIDPNCWCWKDSNRLNPECQKHRRKFEPPEDYGFNINVYEIEEHPDFKNYIRKDRIPCWGCNLKYPAVQNSVSKRSWKFI